ncbi:MAG: domain containing protein [Acidobacteria bacterium]|nr:domain containing protein [Acidobacteriota bacterium]
MASCRLIRTAIATVLLVTAATVHAQDCVTQSVSVAQPVVFPNRAAGPVAWSGSIIGMAKGATDGSNAIYFATYDRNLNQLTDDRLVASQSAGRAIKLLWTGSEFGLFYRTPGSQFVLQRASANGDLIGAPIIVSPHNAADDQEFDFIWDPFRQLYLSALTVRTGFNPGLHLVGIAPDGSVAIDQLVSFFVGDRPAPRISVTQSGIIGIVWGYPDTGVGPGLSFVTLDATNAPRPYQQIAGYGTTSRIATDGTFFAVAYNKPKLGGGSDIRWARISAATGDIVAPESLLLTGKGLDAAPVWLLWNPLRNEWAMSYLDAVIGFGVFPPEYRLHRFLSDGTTLGDSLFTDDPVKSVISGEHAFVPAGFGYLTTTERNYSRAEGSESYLIRNCPLAAIITTSRQPVVGLPVTFGTIISGGVQPLTYFWDFGDANFSGQPNPTHTFVQPASYRVTLTVTDATNATYIAQQVYNVASDPCSGMPLVLPITVTADKPFALPNDLVTFRATPPSSSPTGVLYRWNFGDGSATVDAGGIVTHRFTRQGTFIVTATPSVNGCSAASGTPVSVRVTVSSKQRAARR